MQTHERHGPFCAAEQCDNFADTQINNVMIDGKLFTVYVCNDCVAEMDNST